MRSNFRPSLMARLASMHLRAGNAPSPVTCLTIGCHCIRNTICLECQPAVCKLWVTTMCNVHVRMNDLPTMRPISIKHVTASLSPQQSCDIFSHDTSKLTSCVPASQHQTQCECDKVPCTVQPTTRVLPHFEYPPPPEPTNLNGYA